MYLSLLTPPLRKLERVMAKLEPLSDQHGLVQFLRNVDNTKTLTGFVQELADAITDYQVRIADCTLVFTEGLARFQFNKECTRGQGSSLEIQRTSSKIQRKFLVIWRTFK